MFLPKCLSNCRSSTNHLPFHPIWWRISGCAPALRHYSFSKTLHLKWLTVLWIRLFLDNCSVICTVTLCYILHETHWEFSHIHYSVLSSLCRHIKSYLGLLSHIHAYWDNIKAYSGFFRHMSTFRNSCIFTTLSYFEPWHI